MDDTDGQPVKADKVVNTKRPNFFQRLRRSFTLVFRRRNNPKRNKSESHVPEKLDDCANTAEEVNLSSSLSNEPLPEIVNDPEVTGDSLKPLENNFRPVAKVPLFINDFTSELKQSLKLRSRKIEEGEKSPTDAIKQIENLKTLNSVPYEEKTDVKIEIETKTFEEKLALFESQISGGSESVHDTLKRVKDGNNENEKEDVENPEKEKDLTNGTFGELEDDNESKTVDDLNDTLVEATANGNLSPLDTDRPKSAILSAEVDESLTHRVDSNEEMEMSLEDDRCPQYPPTDNTTAEMQ